MYQEDLTIINFYTPNYTSSECMNQKVTEIKGEIDKYGILFENFSTPFSVIDRSTLNPVSF